MAKIGRPKVDNPADIQMRIRLNKEDADKLDKCADALKTTKSDVVRKGIDNIYQGIKNRKPTTAK